MGEQLVKGWVAAQLEKCKAAEHLVMIDVVHSFHILQNVHLLLY